MLIDTHCHLDAPAFDNDRLSIISQAQTAGVAAQIVPAISAARWPALRHTCTLSPHLYPAYGLHPIFLDEHRPQHIHLLRQWIQQQNPIAIGECGLDYFIPKLNPQQQQYYFQQQLQLAHEFNLPLIIHARRSVDTVIAAIRKMPPLRGVIHSFSGSPQQAQQLFQLGFLIGLGGPLTYPRATRLRRLVTHIPLQQLLLETDSPDQPDAKIPGQRNTPARLTTILNTIAELRQQPAEEIAQQTTQNACQLFGLNL